MADLLLPKSFTSPTYGQLNWEETLKKVAWFMSLDTVASYDVIIGTDSEAILSRQLLCIRGGEAEFISGEDKSLRILIQ